MKTLSPLSLVQKWELWGLVEMVVTAKNHMPYCDKVRRGHWAPIQQPLFLRETRGPLQCWHHFLSLQWDCSVQLLSHVQLSATPWTAVCQASLSITNSWSLLRLMSIESVIPANHLVLCCPLLLPPSIFPSIRVFSDESVLPIRWAK